MKKEAVLVIAGPTGAGKTALAVELAQAVDAEIVSADAYQVYRGLPILTAQPSAAEQAAVPHHLIGVRDPAEEFSAADFASLASSAIQEIQARGRLPLVVGGSGFYLNALFGGAAIAPPPAAGLREQLAALDLAEMLRRLAEADPEAARQVDGKNPRRVQRALEIVLTSGQPFRTFAPRPEALPRGMVLAPAREELRRRIAHRAEAMLRDGAAEEVAALGKFSATAAKIIGLRDIQAWLAGEIARAECLARIDRATWQYARRQLTWFRHQTPWPLLTLDAARSELRDSGEKGRRLTTEFRPLSAAAARF